MRLINMNILFRSSCDAAVREYVRSILVKRREESRKREFDILKTRMRESRRSLCRRMASIEREQAKTMRYCEDLVLEAQDVRVCVLEIESRLKDLQNEFRERVDYVEAKLLTGEQLCAERTFTTCVVGDFARLADNELNLGAVKKDWVDVDWTQI